MAAEGFLGTGGFGGFGAVGFVAFGDETLGTGAPFATGAGFDAIVAVRLTGAFAVLAGADLAGAALVDALAGAALVVFAGAFAGRLDGAAFTGFAARLAVDPTPAVAFAGFGAARPDRAGFPVTAFAGRLALPALGISKRLPGQKAAHHITMPMALRSPLIAVPAGTPTPPAVPGRFGQVRDLLHPAVDVGPGATLPVADDLLEPAAKAVEPDVGDPEPLGPARCAAGQFHLPGRHAERLHQQFGAFVVRPTALRWCRDPHLERSAVPADHRGAPCARLHVHVENDFRSRVLPVALLTAYLEQVVDHGRVL
jgi:hypothetical protein